MALKYTRVKDKSTGHQYDVLSHKVDPEAHEPLKDPERWPDVSYPRPAKPNVKSPRPTAAAGDKPARAARAAKPAKPAAPSTPDGDPS